MKYILQIFLVLLTIKALGQTMYEAPKSNSTILSSIDTPINFSTGIPDIGVDLFNIQTINPNFSLRLRLQHDLYSNSSAYYTTNEIGDIWRLNILPKIIRTSKRNLGINPNLPCTDEMDLWYKNYIPEATSSSLDDIFSYEIFGISGKFKIKRNNNIFTIDVIEQNDFAEIKVNVDIQSYTSEGIKYRIQSFNITDKNGIQYLFAQADLYKLHDNNEFRSDFHLTKITDKYSNVLCEYIYEINRNFTVSSQPTYSFKKIQHIIKQINVSKIGVIDFNLIPFYKNTLILSNLKGENLKKIEFEFEHLLKETSNGQFSKKALNKLHLYSKENTKKETYLFEYNKKDNLINVKLSDAGYLFREDKFNDISYAFKDFLYFDVFSLNKITYPTGGCIFYEFDINDFALEDPSFDKARELVMQQYKEYNSNNFRFENISLIHDPINSRFLVDPYSIANADYRQIFINYDANYFYPLSLPGSTNNIIPLYPKLEIKSYLLSSNYLPQYGTTEKIFVKNGDNSEHGLKHFFYNKLFSINYEANKANYYNYISASLIIYKSDSEIEKRIYTPGLRIKKITSFDINISLNNFKSNNYNVIPSNEVEYQYSKFGEPNTSSGRTKLGIEFATHTYSIIDNYSDLIFYTNVSEISKNLGETRYTFDFLNSNSIENYETFPTNSFVRRLPTKIVKKDESGNIIEENIITRTFKEFNPSVSGINKQPIITYEKVVNRNFVNGNSTPLELITESRFDTISRNLTSKKIINSFLGETFEEQYTYVKHNDSYLPKTVNKFKNGIALNHSENIYTIKKCRVIGRPVSSLYNLIRTEIAKADLPLEIENEYTDYSCDGKLLEYKTKDGVYVSQIWGYNGAFVIAELHNIRYTEIDQQTLSNLITAANKTDLTYNENTIRNLVNQLRTAHPNAKIKSYTFNPLVGMTSMTDVNGRDEFYEYDIFNKLYRIKDHSGLILKEYNYNYKN